MKIVKVAVALLIATAYGCGGGGGGALSGLPTVEVSGVASKGLLSNAKITVFTVDENGTKTQFGTSTYTTNDKGEYNIPGLPASSTVLLELSADSSTKMVDEVTGLVVPAPSDLSLKSAVQVASSAGAKTTATIDVFSNIVVENLVLNKQPIKPSTLLESNAFVGKAFSVDLTEVPTFAADGSTAKSDRAARLAAIAAMASSGSDSLKCAAKDVACVVKNLAQSVADTSSKKDAGAATYDKAISEFNTKITTVKVEGVSKPSPAIASTNLTTSTASSSTGDSSGSSSTASSGSSTGSSPSSSSGSSSTASSSSSTGSSPSSSSGSSSTASSGSSSGSSSSASSGTSGGSVAALSDVEQAKKFFGTLKTELGQLGYKTPNATASTTPTIQSMIDQITADTNSKAIYLGNEVDTLTLATKIIGFLDDLNTNKYTLPSLFGSNGQSTTSTSFRIQYQMNGVYIGCAVYENAASWYSLTPLTYKEISNQTKSWTLISCRNPSSSSVFLKPGSGTERIYAGQSIVIEKPAANSNEYVVRSQLRVAAETLEGGIWKANSAFRMTRPAILESQTVPQAYFDALPKMTVKVSKSNPVLGYGQGNIDGYKVVGEMAPGVKVNNPTTVKSDYTFDSDKVKVDLNMTKVDTSSVSKISDSYQINFVGTFSLFDASTTPFSVQDISFGANSYIRETKETPKSGYDALSLGFVYNTYDDKGTTKATVSGQLGVKDFVAKTIGGTDYYEPTTMSFDGKFAYAQTGTADLNVSITRKNYLAFNPSSQKGPNNYEGISASITGKLKLNNQAAISLTANVDESVKGYKQSSGTIAYNAEGDSTYWIIKGDNDKSSATPNSTLTWTAVGPQLSLTIKNNEKVAELRRNATEVIGTIDTSAKKITYKDGSFEQF